jgi:hypothetical protein
MMIIKFNHVVVYNTDSNIEDSETRETITIDTSKFDVSENSPFSFENSYVEHIIKDALESDGDCETSTSMKYSFIDNLDWYNHLKTDAKPDRIVDVTIYV